MRTKLEDGFLSVSHDVFTSIAGHAATNCFGVKGMASRNMQDGLVHLLKRENLAKGVKISCPEGSVGIDIDLHIVVEYGVNIPAICQSIMEEVRYHVQQQTGVNVTAVNVFVDSIMTLSSKRKGD
ncbi:MAG: Asp23/Gls24 family envelope stress response protein [Oscillospiraceae bacterium]|nr:Asp23/Gls24 family envelope stress response protein [Oscillospiraceae bacterium]